MLTWVRCYNLTDFQILIVDCVLCGIFDSLSPKHIADNPKMHHWNASYVFWVEYINNCSLECKKQVVNTEPGNDQQKNILKVIGWSNCDPVYWCICLTSHNLKYVLYASLGLSVLNVCHIPNQLSVSLMSSICLIGLITLNVCYMSHWSQWVKVAYASPFLSALNSCL